MVQPWNGVVNTVGSFFSGWKLPWPTNSNSNPNLVANQQPEPPKGFGYRLYGPNDIRYLGASGLRDPRLDWQNVPPAYAQNVLPAYAQNVLPAYAQNVPPAYAQNYATSYEVVNRPPC